MCFLYNVQIVPMNKVHMLYFRASFCCKLKIFCLKSSNECLIFLKWLFKKSLFKKLFIYRYIQQRPSTHLVYWVEGDKVSSFFFEAFNNMLNSCFYFCLMNKVHNIFELCSLHCSHGKSITRMEQQSTERFWRSYWFLPIISREIHLGKKICLIMLFDNLACQCETRNSDIHHEVLWYSNF